ncbi:hypothetical protein [Dyadobacter psychrotolerans]|uniref:Secretion system C-terminal sorting domain-containing protein n=1 Tax=Dyadobacter psychrotolerans TaxID=2541721 RepID=A0A4R5DQM8_9BACT|nr:hypothetical protein [Dyadobacter psychrotolerans]TDE16696.1 hypothetical protein E0F88_10735 [Dyadobacter psychrotolerans]
MKITIISKLLFAFIFTLSLSSYAADKKGAKDKKETKSASLNASLFQIINSNKVKLAIDKGADSPVRILLRDVTGHTYYSEMSGKDQAQYRKTFDLAEMTDGTYYFELFYKNQKITKEIQLQTNQARRISVQ